MVNNKVIFWRVLSSDEKAKHLLLSRSPSASWAERLAEAVWSRRNGIGLGMDK